MLMTKTFGLVVARELHEPAPLNCEGTCGRVTMHTFATVRMLRLRDSTIKYPVEHDCYTCDVCGHERVWG